LVRERICENLSACGIVLDRQRNNETVDREGAITAPASPIPVWVIPTREGLMMAQEASKQNPEALAGGPALRTAS
ncbi:MAG: acetate/propionate family kinase, partial [Bryobacteraceae bacterium]